MKPMLAKEYVGQKLEFPIWANPKIDGIRAVWTGRKLLSRSGKEILGVPHIVEYLNQHCEEMCCDGELYSSKLDFETIAGIVKRTKNIDPKIARQINYHIFDVPFPDISYQERYSIIQEFWFNKPSFIKIVPALKITKMPQNGNLNIYQDKWEGTMLRLGKNLYIGKRSSDLLKIKKFKDAEFLIIDVRPLLTFEKILLTKREPGAKEYADGSWYRNGAPVEVPNMMGSLVCATPYGENFEVGSGFTDKQRAELWANKPIGKMATIQYQELTKHNMPRFPTFKCIRDYD